MGYSIDIGAGSNAPVPPLQPAPANVAAGRASGQVTSEQSSADTVGGVVAGGTQDGITVVYDPIDKTVDFTNTDKGSVAVASHVAAVDPHGDRAYSDAALSAHGAALNPHPQYVAKAGDTMTGALITLASAVGGAGFRLPHGTAPTTPTNGDVWTTTAGMYARINGATVGPFGTGGGGGGGGGGMYTKGAAFAGSPVDPSAAPVVYVVAGAAGTITAATIVGDLAGSATFEVWKTTYAGGPPTSSNKISASAPPTVSASTKSRDTTLTGWTTAVAAGDIIAFKILTSSTFKWVSVTLEITP